MSRQNLEQLLVIVFGAIILLIAAFYNGFPLVYSDTSTYMESGFSLQTPVDRPITYGLFIRLFSFNGVSLWFAAFFQSVLLSYMLFITIKYFSSFKHTNRLFLILIILLSLCTVLPFVSGQIIADIFQSISFLCIVNILLNRNLNKRQVVIVFIIFFISTAMHMSHIVINILFVIGIVISNKSLFKSLKPLNKSKISIVLIVSILGIVTMGSAVSKSKNTFFMGRLAENGILIEYLNDNCEHESFRLCECIDSIPRNTTDFLWDENSPLATRFSSWKDAQPEFGEIIKGTFSDSKYIWMHIKESVKSTYRQLGSFDAGDGNGSFVGNELLFKRVKMYFPNDVETYIEARQSKGLLKSNYLRTLNSFYKAIIILSVALIILFFLINKFRNILSSELKFLTLIFLIGIFINSSVNSILVITTDRFGAKVIWFIPLIALLIGSEIIVNYKNRNSN